VDLKLFSFGLETRQALGTLTKKKAEGQRLISGPLPEAAQREDHLSS
jgi:hypothetical protein